MSTKKDAPVHHGKQLEYLMEHSALVDAAAIAPQLKCTPSAIYQMINKEALKHSKCHQQILEFCAESYLSRTRCKAHCALRCISKKELRTIAGNNLEAS